MNKQLPNWYLVVDILVQCTVHTQICYITMLNTPSQSQNFVQFPNFGLVVLIPVLINIAGTKINQNS